jgi:predicted Zn-dependent peptidase
MKSLRTFPIGSIPSFCGLVALAALLLVLAPAAGRAQESPIKLGPPAALRLPTPSHFDLGNGLKVVLMENHKVALVEIEMIVKGGAALDPSGKTGLATMTAEMMEEGAGTRNSLEYADAVDFLGASVSAYSSMHSSGVSLFTPLSKLDSAMGLFADMVLRPAFPAGELERLRNERLTSLTQSHDQPRAIASAAFAGVLYGTAHPYGKTSIGDEASIRGISIDDVKASHGRIYSPKNATVIVVGDITPDAARSTVEKYFGSWQGGAVETPAVATAPQVKSREIILVDKPGAAQSEIRIGRIGTDRLTPDYFPLLVMNTILGGSFSSRLNQNLRERNGYTYGAGSGFDFRLSAGPFRASAAVQTDVTDKALVEFMKELDAIREPVSDAELTRAKNYLALLYPNNFETISDAAGQIAELVVYGLPDETFNTYVGNVLAVTKDQVSAMAKKYIDTENIEIVVVGDRQKIEAGIAALKLGTLRNLTIDEVLGPAPKTGAGQ